MTKRIIINSCIFFTICGSISDRCSSLKLTNALVVAPLVAVAGDFAASFAVPVFASASAIDSDAVAAVAVDSTYAAVEDYS